ncbi:MAG TPA: MFS transporter [Candidatus Binatia bacterium]|jgi:ACS family glucarate transporter-like MFS transporter|nr:MFS transporter [Candidatus Binatia bacterium]
MEGPETRPTHARWTILSFVFLISVVTVVDRVNISVAAKYIMPEYGLSQVQMGTIFSAFIVGYTLSFIPGGWLGDRFGPRRVLTGALLAWSFLTVVTAWAGDIFLASLFGVVGSFLCIRFLFGMGEGPAYPNANRLAANWFPLTEKALATSVSLAGVGVGAMVASPLVAWIMVGWGWRAAFYVTGIAGIFVAASWYYYGRDYPEEHSAVNSAELRWIRGENDPHIPHSAFRIPHSVSVTPWRLLLSSRDLWLMIVSYLGLTYIAYTFVSWFYLYVVNELHFSVQTGAWLATLPFVTIVFFSPCGGLVSDAAVKRYGVRFGRIGVACASLLLTALFLHLGAVATNPYATIVLLSLGHGFLFVTGAVYWASIIEMAREHAGTATGLLLTGGHLGGIIGPTLSPLLAERFGWTVAFECLAGAALLAASICAFVHPERPLGVPLASAPSLKDTLPAPFDKREEPAG